jgi:transglutaminase-like putative cysteine protease
MRRRDLDAEAGACRFQPMNRRDFAAIMFMLAFLAGACATENRRPDETAGAPPSWPPGHRAADNWMPGRWAADPYAPAAATLPPAEHPRRWRVTVEGQFRVERNPRNEDIRLFLPLPADSPYQRLHAYGLDPPPTEIRDSRNGHQIAVFNVGKPPVGSSIAIRYSAVATVGKIHWPIDPEKIGPLSEVPGPVADVYLQDGPFLKIHDPALEQAAREAVGDERRPFQMTARILSFVNKRLTYKMHSAKLDAVETLRLGHGSCTEHSFVIIALARTLGLPARYIAGSAIRRDLVHGEYLDHVNHKIVEVYLPRFGWTPVESTGNRELGATEPQRYIGASMHLMLFFATECEPGVAPLDPRANLFTVAPFGERTEVRLAPHVVTRWNEID